MQEYDEGLMNYMLSNAYKTHKTFKEEQVPLPVDDLDEDEAIRVFNELLNVFTEHNLSYKNSYRISLALTTALAAGGIELYKNEK